MSDKISPVAVVKEAVAITWARKGTLVGISVLGMMPTLFMIGIQITFPDIAGLVGVVGGLCAIVMGAFVYTMLNHTAIAHMRGANDFFPKNIVLTMWRVFIRGLITYLGMILPPLIGLLPLVVVQIYSSSAGEELSNGFITMGMIGSSVGGIVGFSLLFRLSVMIPGAATGRVVKMKEAFAMTKGHVWRMIGSLVLTILPLLILQFMFVMILGASGTQTTVSSASVFFFFLMPLVMGVASIVSVIILPVWYEKLRLRENAVIAPQDAGGAAK